MNRREEEIMNEQKTDEPQQLQSFEIKVQNKFDEDKRSIIACHDDKKIQKEKKCFLIPHSVPTQRPDQVHELNLSLGPHDSLVIEMWEEGNFKEFKKDVYIELPFIADYKFYWEVELREGEDVVKKQVDRPITCITRNTAPHHQKPTEDGKTVIKIPGDQRAWKLEIMSPRNLNEHYRPKNLLGKVLPSNGTPDSVSVGDNGP